MHGELPNKLKQAASRRRYFAGALIVAAIAAALIYVFAWPVPAPKRFNRFAAEGPVPVLMATVSRADVPVYLDAVGTTRPLNTVTVRPQVDGKLIEVDFKEGQDVKKGDVLARIDPAIYKAQLDQVVAKKAQDQAQLANAKNDLARYEKLAVTNAINKQQADTQKALVAQFTALVQADQAAIENAQAMLGYTTVTAPLSGRTGIRMVDEGNYVRASDLSSAIVVITQLKPITVLFNLPQQDLDRVNAAFGKGPLAVDALRSADNKVIERGALTVIDNQVDPTTGTVKLKAEFPNTGLQLWPGQFVNVRLLIDTLQNVVVIPTGAVQRGPNGTFVYVIKPDETAAMRPIAVQKQDETQTVVKSGVTPPERVVTTGFARLTDGAKVSIGSPAPAAAPNSGAPSAHPRNGKPAAAVGQGQQAGEQRRGGGNRPNAQR
jgi:membrane fusion protein, multidrug efflux system